jgi:hypothetical protein
MKVPAALLLVKIRILLETISEAILFLIRLLLYLQELKINRGGRRGRFLRKMFDLETCLILHEFRVKDWPLALSLRVLRG